MTVPVPELKTSASFSAMTASDQSTPAGEALRALCASRFVAGVRGRVAAPMPPTCAAGYVDIPFEVPAMIRLPLQLPLLVDVVAAGGSGSFQANATAAELPANGTAADICCIIADEFDMVYIMPIGKFAINVGDSQVVVDDALFEELGKNLSMNTPAPELRAAQAEHSARLKPYMGSSKRE